MDFFVEQTIHASPEAVAEVMFDPGREDEWISKGVKAELLTPGPPAVGSRVRHEAGIPTMTVGNISSYADVNSILVAGRADLCVLARAHLYDPYWTRHAATEQGYTLPWPDQYVSVAGYQPRFT